MNKQEIIEYYSREDIINELVKNSKDREVVGAYFDGSYDSRPNMIQYPSDIVQMAKKGITSFHISVEKWKNVMQLTNENYEQLRKGFDIVIDIDSKIGIDEAQLTATMICNFLERYGIRNYGIKFSGRRGFHICLTNEMFPKEIDFTPFAKQYPKIPRIIAAFIRNSIADDLMRELIRRKSAKELLSILEEPPDKLDPYYFVEVEKDWGSRHLFRAPYSLNEKTWLASLPINFQQLKNFSIESANPKKVKVAEVFFRGEENEAESLLLAALDWNAMMMKEEKAKPKRIISWDKKIDEELFPPCIKLILGGLSDGRKRSIFTLVNFLRMMNWSPQEIQERIFKWNENNKSTLPNSIVLSTIRYHEKRESTPPANCSNNMYYIDIGLCKPDQYCRGIKNPVTYPFRIMKKKKVEWKSPLFKCAKCDKAFKTRKSLDIHVGRTHGSDI
ncbi:MAG: DNA primase small subunit domain-containing protein [Candidatus Aenigmatarchaeota archaeon]